MITLAFVTGDAPFLRFHLLERVTADDNTEQIVDFDLEGATVQMRLVALTQGVPGMLVPMQILDDSSGLVGYKIARSWLPGQVPPLVMPPNSFGYPCTYQGEIIVITNPPDGSEPEPLTAEEFQIIVRRRP